MNLIQMREGPLLREDSILLALDLEQSGHALTVRGEALEVSEAKTLTTAQRHALSHPDEHERRAVLRHIIALLGYCQTAPEAR